MRRLSAAARRHAPRIRWISLALLAAGALLAVHRLPLEEAVEPAKAWLDDLGALAPLAYSLIYVAGVVAFLPGSVLTMAAGMFFGLGTGTWVSSLSSTTGASLAFLVGRYLARERVESFARQHPRYRAVDQAIGEGGWKVVFLFRLSPALPFNVQNYLFGLTPVPFWQYVLASLVAMLPGTFLFVYLGHVTAAATLGQERERTTGEWVLLFAGALATIVASLYVTRMARAKLAAGAKLPEGKTRCH